jgi:formylglycine-generating enzyme required for sulfatase activity
MPQREREEIMNRVRTCASVCVLAALCPDPTQASVVIETVTVANPGNAPDTRFSTLGYGGVDYEYVIGSYEMTAGQYCEFLNSVADTDTYALYNPEMWSNPYGCKIERSGTPGSYTYSVAVDWASRPVNYVSWGDAARFANWLHNGQPTGLQGLSTTEDGSYFLNGVVGDAALLAIAREPDATWVIPSEDEWYKAAYHKNDPGAAGGNYWSYPTSSSSVPRYVNNSGDLSGTGTPFAEGGTDPGNYATLDGDVDNDDNIPGIGPPYYRTVVGEWENSGSPYGTFDQGGNVWEWSEAVIGASRGLRGGSFSSAQLNLHAAARSNTNPSGEYYSFGFRVALVPEPATLVILALASVGVLGRTQ